VKISGKLNEDREIGVAVRDDMPQLVSIFNKAIDNLTEETHRKILNKWVSVKFENKQNFKYLWETLALITLIISFLSYRQYVLNKKNTLLKESISEFEHLIDSTIEAIYVTERGKCIDCNNAGFKLLGYENKDALLGVNVLDVVDPKFHDTVIENIKRTSIEPYEITMIRKDGSKFPALVKGKNFMLKNKAVRVTGIIDLTKLKDNEKLIIEQSKMAALGEMLENIAHQWRQPLSVISTAASGVKIQKEYGLLKDEQFIESMDGIINNANYLSKTIDDFRNFILADKKMINFNLKAHIENDLSILYSMTHVNNIEVICNIDEKIYLNTIESELTQAIINIINNAKDQFIKEEIDERFIFVSTSTNDNKVTIHIKDNANGIDEKILAKIFEPYFTTKHKKVGTGLGLYMTSKIINESLKGSISVENVNYEYKDIKYKGAQFNIELPLS
jgi:PAS domain S-box-containing protein